MKRNSNGIEINVRVSFLNFQRNIWNSVSFTPKKIISKIQFKIDFNTYAS